MDGESITYNVDGELMLAAGNPGAGKFLKYDSPGVLVWDNLPGGGDMLGSNNLNDLQSVAAARTNLGLGALATKSAVGSSDITDGSITGSDIAAGIAAGATDAAKDALCASELGTSYEAATFNGVPWSPCYTSASPLPGPFNVAGSTSSYKHNEANKSTATAATAPLACIRKP